MSAVASSPLVSAGAILNWDTSITVVSDEGVRARLTATSVKSKQETQPGFISVISTGLPEDCSALPDLFYSLSTLY